MFIQRDGAGKIVGCFAASQPGFAEESLPDDSAELLSFLNPPEPIPQSVTPRQARLALLNAGLLTQVEAAVNAAGGATKITWDYATQVNRGDALITSIGAALNLTSEQIDALFVYAAKQ